MTYPSRGDLLELSSGDAVVWIDPGNGGRVVSLDVGGTNLLSGAAPGRAGPPGILNGCFPMVPFVGRLGGGEFTFEGRRWQLPRVHEGHAIHGLVYDRAWTVTGEDTLSIDLDERWPFGGSVQQSFELGPDSLQIRLVVSNHQRVMPATAGFHPWFRRDAYGYSANLSFAASHRYSCDDSGIPTDVTTDLGSRPWDDSFVGPSGTPSVRWGDQLELFVESRADHWIVCETDRQALCVEPLTGPVNDLNSPACRTVGPSRPLEHVMTLRWGKPDLDAR
jgi:aldose 1-epimerase